MLMAQRRTAPFSGDSVPLALVSTSLPCKDVVGILQASILSHAALRLQSSGHPEQIAGFHGGA
eukprot:1256558-Amphidinium_carterae.1